jgi:hypothetical protein
VGSTLAETLLGIETCYPDMMPLYLKCSTLAETLLGIETDLENLKRIKNEFYFG